jgi:hypothetical protein
MRVERWFNVLVLGGAALANACARGPEEKGSTPEGHSGTAPTAGDVADGGGGATNTNGPAAGGGVASGGIASTAGAANASGGAGSSGSAGHPSGGAAGGASDAGSGPSAPVGGDTSGGMSGSAGNASGGSAGAAAGLECHTDAKGFGKSSDACGCPCCWARDCSNTEACCDGFCKNADSGRGCCAP